MNTQKELHKLANHLVLNLLFYTKVQDDSLNSIKAGNYEDIKDMRKQLKHFFNTYLFSDSGIEIIYNYIEEQLSK